MNRNSHSIEQRSSELYEFFSNILNPVTKTNIYVDVCWHKVDTLTNFICAFLIFRLHSWLYWRAKLVNWMFCSVDYEWMVEKKWHGWCNIYVSRLLKLILMCLFNYVEYLWPNSALCYHYQDERRYIRSQLSNPHVSRHRGWRFDRSWHTRLWIRFHWIHDPFSEPNAGIASRANSWTNTG